MFVLSFFYGARDPQKEIEQKQQSERRTVTKYKKKKKKKKRHNIYLGHILSSSMFSPHDCPSLLCLTVYILYV